jgi:antitoxin ParD1/3/4
MKTMNVPLPDDMTAFVEAQMAAEGYTSVSDDIGSLIRDAQKRQAKRALDAKLREGLESGPATLMTRQDWDSIEREAFGRLAREQASQ